MKFKQKTLISGKIKAAQYVRMSTEHQQYSTENQMDVIRDYALANDMEIMKTYSDEGKSGLQLKNRDGLKSLIYDVKNNLAEYSVILVYDISRWGRFQDVDQGAYLEFTCKEKGISLHYCAEIFRNDGSMFSSIVKTIKRAMAGEYSRELSAKVFRGQCKLIELGYRQGGVAGYGLRRMRIDNSGNHIGILNHGEYKSLQTDRVILVPGPESEVDVIKTIYDLFISKNKSEREIANSLNESELYLSKEKKWTRGTIHQILTNEKYIGNNVFNRTSFKLKQKRVKNSPDSWIRSVKAFTPIISEEQFLAAKNIIVNRTKKFSDEDILNMLKELLNEYGRISGILIDETETMPSTSVYRSRFGSLLRAYKLIGYTPDKDYQYIEDNKRIKIIYRKTYDEIVDRLCSMDIKIEEDSSGAILASKEIFIKVLLSRCRQLNSGAHRWIIKFEHNINIDIFICARLDTTNSSILDYYIFPAIDLSVYNLKLATHNQFNLDVYRHDSLHFFVNLFKRSKVTGAA